MFAGQIFALDRLSTSYTFDENVSYVVGFSRTDLTTMAYGRLVAFLSGISEELFDSFVPSISQSALLTTSRQSQISGSESKEGPVVTGLSNQCQECESGASIGCS